QPTQGTREELRRQARPHSTRIDLSHPSHRLARRHRTWALCIGHLADADLRIRIPAHLPDALHWSTDQPLVPLARRRTGVKNSGGTARDVVAFLVRSRPRISLTPGAGLPRGRSLSLRARGLDSSARPPVPRAVPPGRLAVLKGEVR